MLPDEHDLTIAVHGPEGRSIREPRVQLLPCRRHDNPVLCSMWGLVRAIPLTDHRVELADGRLLLVTLDLDSLTDGPTDDGYDTAAGVNAVLGVAARTDFALRIALSRVLARRAGTQLRTLIIDEGFGTQDSHGLEQLKEAHHLPGAIPFGCG